MNNKKIYIFRFISYIIQKNGKISIQIKESMSYSSPNYGLYIEIDI